MKKKYYSCPQAAIALGIDVKTVRVGIANRKIKARDVGFGEVNPRWQIDASEIERLKKLYS